METSLFGSEIVGRTYTEKELITYLYLENQYLKNKNPIQVDKSPLSSVELDRVMSEPEYHMVRAYLAKKSSASKAARHLIIANDYPNTGSEYGNGFVHRRASLYNSYGVNVDVLSFGKRKIRDIYTYEGITVLAGYVHELIGLLSSNEYDSISVHFLNQEMWNSIYPFLGKINLYIFLHGYEARRWIRQAYNHKNVTDLKNSIERSNHLQAFWQEVLRHQDKIEKFIFVSEWWKNAVFEDMEISIHNSKTEIVHNFVDTNLFKYIEKEPSQRFNILWVRSAAARNYGHDLAIECIKHLKESKHWPNFSIKIVGDGQYFDEFKSSLGNEDNVEIHKGYLSHSEIARLHSKYGIFLVPTRLDSQGVSRDEAMSSGLVPVTNSVAAVPEFVDDSCALIAPGEDAFEMAKLIIEMVEDPNKFQKLSSAAAKRVREQSSEEHTVMKESRLMGLLSDEGTSK